MRGTPILLLLSIIAALIFVGGFIIGMITSSTILEQEYRKIAEKLNVELEDLPTELHKLINEDRLK